MVATIVVPLDESELAERALPYARGLARREGAQVLFVTAIELPTEFSAMTTAGAIAGDQIEEWVAERRQYLEKTAASFGTISATYRVSMGQPADVIIEAIESTDTPLLVMSSHGRSGLSRLFAGSVASRVLHEVHCPVLLVKANLPDQPAGSAVPFAKALVPLDGSAFGEHALDQALGALEDSGLALHLLRVVDIPATTMAGLNDPSAGTNYALVAEYMDATKVEAKEYLEALAKGLSEAGQAVTWEIREGGISHEIITTADEQNVDLIAMSTHGRGGLGRLVFGSVAERVLHDAKRPLLLVRPKE